MKTLACTCRNCGKSMSIEIEEQELCSEEFLTNMATCDNCYAARERIEKANRDKYDKQIERELQESSKQSKWRRKPYND